MLGGRPDVDPSRSGGLGGRAVEGEAEDGEDGDDEGHAEDDGEGDFLLHRHLADEAKRQGNARDWK